jgi:hypothetical protein
VWKTRTKQQQEAEALFSLLGIPTLQAETLKTMLQQQQQVEDLIWRQVCNLPAVASSAHSTRENFLLPIPPSSLLIRSMDCFLAVQVVPSFCWAVCSFLPFGYASTFVTATTHCLNILSHLQTVISAIKPNHPQKPSFQQKNTWQQQMQTSLKAFPCVYKKHKSLKLP